jgi:hypothetical protein
VWTLANSRFSQWCRERFQISADREQVSATNGECLRFLLGMPRLHLIASGMARSSIAVLRFVVEHQNAGPEIFFRKFFSTSSEIEL